MLCWPISKNSIPSALNPFWRRKRHFMILVPLMSYGGDDDLCFPLIFIAEILLQLRFSLEKKEKTYGMLHSLSFFSARSIKGGFFPLFLCARNQRMLLSRFPIKTFYSSGFFRFCFCGARPIANSLRSSSPIRQEKRGNRSACAGEKYCFLLVCEMKECISIYLSVVLLYKNTFPKKIGT